jgi:pimeloyl-ACP methyl ester carboxylesterase
VIGFIEARPGVRLAIRNDRPQSPLPGIMWLNGFCSDMAGTKATALATYARSTKRPFLRFDYSGHGASQGDFARLTLTDWLEESRRIFETQTRGPRIIAGSSMGGYLALLLYRLLQRERSSVLERIKGLVLVAPARSCCGQSWTIARSAYFSSADSSAGHRSMAATR